MSAKLTYPRDVVVSSGLTERDCLVELAVHLYAKRWITVEQASQICELSREDFDGAFVSRVLS